ncbi:MAG: hypothetical protein A3I44_05405 [Candidatus Sungbacteria bacterium RIFCSPLOWO2_02_FULL_51_17]|uniref:Uncharacterized protein n=1 Tax=Candidatus Sungbacteria bacterium RIFCSPHIGHO2_02_FULL_51_29 TaxID=1802273 RepID=A0A1G2KTE5_9BACT|nr:MAG: hypothetical protein A2676_01120 [Candidatus Sungbacteria bacterium RIFCSPHIGHO2_01_FULL_51_22]OHA01659.1 MAG: hypothetical protein A3C16_04385 [Candidatus Sungbacteria bacterium RIFCSPHIGHO2_02_FULL_51_29]OHA06397.1 MAG: hypothetical protein A3B29_05185 [Candidatus Sungbacteria bacterium RIFCSPLOWO2_01_FULL_51_34]OHA10553.1 MAG: hypothetical protein A3I44_05405 [Candidatus Sungbacteria bacterium RIFCSPLOWO2_02_FULL_51_17]
MLKQEEWMTRLVVGLLLFLGGPVTVAIFSFMRGLPRLKGPSWWEVAAVLLLIVTSYVGAILVYNGLNQKEND